MTAVQLSVAFERNGSVSLKGPLCASVCSVELGPDLETGATARVRLPKGWRVPADGVPAGSLVEPAANGVIWLRRPVVGGRGRRVELRVEIP